VWKKLCKGLYLSQNFKNLTNHLPIHAQSHEKVFSHISRHLKLLPVFLDGCLQFESTYIQGPNIISLCGFFKHPKTRTRDLHPIPQTVFNISFLGAFANLRKATVSFVMSVRMEQLGSRWTDLHKTLSALFRKSVEKFQSFIKIGHE
jgi:hypothetical protein